MVLVMVKVQAQQIKIQEVLNLEDEYQFSYT